MTELLLLAGVLVSAADGDTMTVRQETEQLRVRLAEIDAPERTQPFSQVARRNLDGLCRNRPVELEIVDRDRFGRTVAHVYCDGVHVNWRQVEEGLAWCFDRYLRRTAECKPREEAARKERRGLWQTTHPQSPWDFRAQQRK